MEKNRQSGSPEKSGDVAGDEPIGAAQKRARWKTKLYDSSRIDWEHLPFDNAALRRILIPVMLEQMLNSLMGTVDSMMVSRVGSAAISAVSLTDSINVLVIQVFAALATGGTIICSQYIGRKDLKRGNDAARQVLVTILFSSVLLGSLCIFFRRGLLRLVFGRIEQDVMDAALIYLFLTALSFPFLALFQAGSAFYRAGGNSRFPMIISVISNVMNIAGNALFIFGFGWGVMGAALSTLLSRVFCAVVVFVFLRLPRQNIVIRDYLRIRPEFGLILKILTVGIPAGIENGMFQFGKLAIQSSVSILGTTAIAAQAMTIILEGLNGMAATGIGIGMMTVVGQCIGAGKTEEARYYIVKLTGIAEIVIIILVALIMALTKPITYLAGMEPESAQLCFEMMIFISIMKPLFWTLSFIPVYGIRAAGDVRFSMLVSSMSMWLCRVAVTTFLIRVCKMGPIAVWIGMGLDWFVRSVIYTWRYLSGRWMQHHLV